MLWGIYVWTGSECWCHLMKYMPSRDWNKKNPQVLCNPRPDSWVAHQKKHMFNHICICFTTLYSMFSVGLSSFLTACLLLSGPLLQYACITYARVCSNMINNRVYCFVYALGRSSPCTWVCYVSHLAKRQDRQLKKESWLVFMGVPVKWHNKNICASVFLTPGMAELLKKQFYTDSLAYSHHPYSHMCSHPDTRSSLGLQSPLCTFWHQSPGCWLDFMLPLDYAQPVAGLYWWAAIVMANVVLLV